MWIKKIQNKLAYSLKTPEKYASKIGVKYGKNCEFYKGITWGSEPYLITIGDNVRITKGVSFITHDGGAWVLRNMNKKDRDIDIFGKIEIGNNVHIGWNAIIMPGVTVGDNVIIGAGSIVTKNVESNSVVVGIPARKIETIDEYRKKALVKCDHTKFFSPEKKMKYLLDRYKISG